ncbi:hypothetical protein CGC21_14145 [Leishmania donovani]|uniref:Uncharacterized protein n=1 Tax=Leishmania donovani TaxID=5661 RepID=A0A504XLZ1_LEIDO|nr:hypothetical protein CGC21_14145 [Leishmania donovani]
MDNAFSCSSQDLCALQVEACRHCTSLFRSPGGTCKRACSDVRAALLRQNRTPRKAVQTLTFNEAAVYRRNSRGITSSAPAAGTSLKSPCVAHAAHGCGGGLCATYHIGPHCFPTRRYRAALSGQRHCTKVRGGGFVCGNRDYRSTDESAGAPTSSAPLTPPDSDLWLLWSLVPSHLLVELIQTPQDAEVLLARLKEEQYLLQNSDTAEAPRYSTSEQQRP